MRIGDGVLGTITKVFLVHILALPVVVGDLPPVDVFFGTENGGNVFPGAARPFGMARMGVDMVDTKEGLVYSGYAADGNVAGISMMHESGTGGAPEYGVVAQLPLTKDEDYSKTVSVGRAKADTAEVGNYTVFLSNGITANFAAAERSGIVEYSFPENASAKVMVNVSHHLRADSRPYWTQNFVEGSANVSSELNAYIGHSTIEGGWANQSPWTIYFCSKFDTPADSVISYENGNVNNATFVNSNNKSENIGLVFSFPSGTSKLKSKIGISHISTDQACLNIANEITDFDLEEVVSDAQTAWENEVFSKVTVSDSNSTILQLAYSALYGSHLLPSNKTGENPNWKSSEPYYDDFFTIWDTFRCLNPLLNILNPTRGAEIIRSLTDTYKHVGFTPDGRSANQNGKTQGGSDSDIIFADAFVKDIGGGINWDESYAAMVKNAEEEPPYRLDTFVPGSITNQGRQGISQYKEIGYLSRDYTRSVSKTVEFAYDDFALSVVAKGLHKDDDHEKYLNRSSYWKNLWNKDASSPSCNYTGFLQPRYNNGSWATEKYDPLSCEGCYWANDEYEGKPIEYGWAVPHDIAGLIELIGDNQTFITRLDDMFGLKGHSYADIGNEPSFLTPYLYNYVNAQSKTVETLRYIINHLYSTGASGLPGNSDAGAMQAYLFFALVGFYPVTGTTTYLISSPFVSSVTFNLDNGAKVSITTSNLSSDSFYVQSVQLNGKDWNKNWFSHQDLFSNGGTLHFNLGSSPVKWDTGAEPPSPGHKM